MGDTVASSFGKSATHACCVGPQHEMRNMVHAFSMKVLRKPMLTATSEVDKLPTITLTVTTVRQPVLLQPLERDTSHITHGFAAIQQRSSVCTNDKKNSSRCRRTTSPKTKSWPSHPLRRELLRATFRRDPGSLHQQVSTRARVAPHRRHNTTTQRVLENLSQQDPATNLTTNFQGTCSPPSAPNGVTSRKVVTHLRKVGASPSNPASVPFPCGPTPSASSRMAGAPRHTTSQTQQTCPASAAPSAAVHPNRPLGRDATWRTQWALVPSSGVSPPRRPLPRSLSCAACRQH